MQNRILIPLIVWLILGKLIKFFKGVKISITTDLYKHLYRQGSQPGIMYGLSKIHKPLVNGFPKLRPILSAINTGTYKWANFFVPLLKPFTSNNYTAKDSFDFAKGFTQQSSNFLWLPLMWILFSQTCHLMAIEICVNELFKSRCRLQIFIYDQFSECYSCISFCPICSYTILQFCLVNFAVLFKQLF